MQLLIIVGLIVAAIVTENWAFAWLAAGTFVVTIVLPVLVANWIINKF